MMPATDIETVRSRLLGKQHYLFVADHPGTRVLGVLQNAFAFRDVECDAIEIELFNPPTGHLGKLMSLLIAPKREVPYQVINALLMLCGVEHQMRDESQDVIGIAEDVEAVTILMESICENRGHELKPGAN
jgi:hypothetical protein